MSTAFEDKDFSAGFQRRFVSVCGTSSPSVISDYLDISYQAAKNYLNGRMPEVKILLKIAEKTPCSIHWLLTGEGDKFVDHSRRSEAELLATVLSEVADPVILRKMFEVVSRERNTAAISTPSATEKNRTVKIPKKNIRKEKQYFPKVAPLKKS